MLRSHRLCLLLACSWLSACSMVVDFDRDKIDRGPSEDGSVEGDGSTDVGDLDAARPDANLPDANLPDADLSDGDTGECMSESDCAGDQLCCDGACVEPSFEHCSACNQGCSAQGAAACVNRTCECTAGSGAECAADAPLCRGAEGSKACVECQDSSDCAGRADGKNECVEQVCVACNPANNAGCGGNTPICNATTFSCEKCTLGASDNCDAPLVCTASGACGGCADSTDDCKNPTAPICDDTTTQCKACGSSLECHAEFGSAAGDRRFCVAGGRCAVCVPYNAMPNPNNGCADVTKPVCVENDNTGRYACQACTEEDHCANVTGRTHCKRSGPQSGQCVECVSDGQCAGAQVCDTTANKCVQCNGDAQCGSGHCNTATHQCQACVDNTHCGGDTPICGASGQCRGCGNGNGTECSGALVCDTAAQKCVTCLSDAQCGSNHCNVATHQCQACVTNAHCGGDTPICEAGQCRGCEADNECAGTPATPVCDTVANKCVQCTSAAQCSGGDRCHPAACNANTCTYPAKDTSDGLSCTDDACELATGNVTHTNTCPQDSSPCTRPSTCEAGGCSAQEPEDTLCPGTQVCVSVGASIFACHECDPSPNAAPCPTGEVCNPASYVCEAADPGPVEPEE